MSRSGRVQSSVTLAWFLTATSLISFMLLALAVSQDLTGNVDRAILTGFRDSAGDIRGPLWLRESLIEITTLGGYPVIVLVMLAAITGLYCVGRKKAALILATSVGGGSALSSVLKLLFDRPRPNLVEHLDQIYTSSFPSAHAMVSMVAWLTLAVVLMRYVTNDRLRTFMLSSAVILSLLIGFSRVYLGVHWPSDVLAGWLMGIAWACASWLCAHYLAHDKRRIGLYGRST